MHCLNVHTFNSVDSDTLKQKQQKMSGVFYFKKLTPHALSPIKANYNSYNLFCAEETFILRHSNGNLPINISVAKTIETEDYFLKIIPPKALSKCYIHVADTSFEISPHEIILNISVTNNSPFDFRFNTGDLIGQLIFQKYEDITLIELSAVTEYDKESSSEHDSEPNDEEWNTATTTTSGRGKSVNRRGRSRGRSRGGKRGGNQEGRGRNLRKSKNKNLRVPIKQLRVPIKYM